MKINVKSIFAVLLAMTIMLAMTACGKDADNSVNNDAPKKEAYSASDTDGWDDELNGYKWDSIGLPEDFPKLSDSLSDFEYRDSGFYTLRWKTIEENDVLEMVKRLENWTGTTAEKSKWVSIKDEEEGNDGSDQWLINSDKGDFECLYSPVIYDDYMTQFYIEFDLHN